MPPQSVDSPSHRELTRLYRICDYLCAATGGLVVGWIAWTPLPVTIIPTYVGWVLLGLSIPVGVAWWLIRRAIRDQLAIIRVGDQTEELVLDVGATDTIMPPVVDI